jgi:hypothetical protein
MIVLQKKSKKIENPLESYVLKVVRIRQNPNYQFFSSNTGHIRKGLKSLDEEKSTNYSL